MNIRVTEWYIKHKNKIMLRKCYKKITNILQLQKTIEKV